MTAWYQHQRADRAHDLPHSFANYDQASQSWLTRVSACLKAAVRRDSSKYVYSSIAQTPQERRDASLTEPAFDTKLSSTSEVAAANEKGKTILYLAYGSNLCNETFRGNRGIKPLSQINVLVPSLRLTFDLPGIPYIEPCFGNTHMRDPDVVESTDYHKDRWKKGLVGCVYEVTPTDYAHIIATEGGYDDILVDCYPLPDGDVVPEKPTTQRFVAHTLFAPATKSNARPDPSYAQPSARYLNLITTGATELSLPREYQDYLNDIRTYTITTKRQQIGKMLFVSIWFPCLQLLFALKEQFHDDKGRMPGWLAQLADVLFSGMWLCYDATFKKAFGDGERTEGDEKSRKKQYITNEEDWRRIGEENGWFHNKGDAGDLV